MLCGYQSIMFAVFAKTFAISEGLLPPDARIEPLSKLVDARARLLLGAGRDGDRDCAARSSPINAVARSTTSAALDYASTMRVVVPGVTLAALGFQTMLSSFFLSLLGMRRR